MKDIMAPFGRVYPRNQKW